MWLQESIVLWDMFTSRPYVITSEFLLLSKHHLRRAGCTLIVIFSSQVGVSYLLNKEGNY